MPKREPLLVITLLPLPQEADLSQEDEVTGNVHAVPPALRVVPDPRVADPCIAGGLVDPPRGPVRAVQSTKSVGSTLALEETPEQKGAPVRDTSRTNVIRGGVSSDIRALADTSSVKVIALKVINAITHISR